MNLKEHKEGSGGKLRRAPSPPTALPEPELHLGETEQTHGLDKTVTHFHLGTSSSQVQRAAGKASVTGLWEGLGLWELDRLASALKSGSYCVNLTKGLLLWGLSFLGVKLNNANNRMTGPRKACVREEESLCEDS